MSNTGTLSKQQMIDEIRQHNRSANDQFLIKFNETALRQYLERLTLLHNHRGKDSRWVRTGPAPAIVIPRRDAA